MLWAINRQWLLSVPIESLAEVRVAAQHVRDAPTSPEGNFLTLRH